MTPVLICQTPLAQTYWRQPYSATFHAKHMQQSGVRRGACSHGMLSAMRSMGGPL